MFKSFKKLTLISVPVPLPYLSRVAIWCGWACCAQWRGAWRSYFSTHHVNRHNTPIHNTLLLNWASHRRHLGTLPEDGNVMSKHVGATIHN
jgi:hypothetical protein